MYQPPKGPVIGTGVVALGAMTAMHQMLLAVTICFSLFIVSRLVRRGVNKSRR